jgi:hypothetical protein
MNALSRLLGALVCEAFGHRKGLVVGIATIEDGELVLTGHLHLCTRCGAQHDCPRGEP